ncbi:signal peptide peptidase SppA [Lutibacter sp. HS1-25]|uniref:signal peptide peptidase SppA n=1 Tax=Lutibacter sp. HS1-25 TaxID=2485000 RepID=UPI0010103C90|nr:signal peptide peptidase SppA [Lutibacter sp. HS1-25]RXP58638.1 signal peptide peptidase SppA [Lutibacter sp. HS1-25]
MNFLRNLLASIIGTFITLGLILFLLIVVVFAMSEDEEIVVKENTVLEIKLDKTVKDYAPKSDDPFDEIFGTNNKKMGLNEIINAIENAKYDDNIKGISINSLNINAGISQTKEIRNKLAEFKETGKFVNAYADVYDQKGYYLASVADSVFINPVGELAFKGLSSEVLFFKNLQEKTGVKMEVIRHGKYKSAVEPFLENEMSENNREQISSFLKSIWGEMLNDISESRNISVDELNHIADGLLGRNAVLAVENKLVDGALYWDEYEAKLKHLLGISNEDKINSITLKDYISTGKGRVIESGSDKIAVIYAQGEIIYGKGDEEYIGPELIIKAIREAVKLSSTKAIVLRINSPGGSALASELIWREIELAKKELPIVVSMGDMAASGGYYIACNANKIIAEPTTITGSIGVFGVLPNISTLAENIGINAEQVNTNKSASYSLFEPMTNEFKTVTQEGVEFVYTTFVKHVAEGRNMTFDEVDKIAQGRVWSGVEAKEVGLVDELGGLRTAVIEAAGLAGITDYKVRNYPSYKIDFEERFDGFPFASSKEEMMIKEFGEANYKLYQNLKQFSQITGIQARLPFLVEIN